MPGIRHLQARIDGLISGNQTWSITPKFTYPTSGVPTQASMDAWVAAILQLNNGAIAPMKDLWSSAVSVTGATCSYVDDTGKSVVISKGLLEAAVPGTGSAGMPAQCSVVTTLQTNVPGRRARGRLYWPLLAAAIDGSTLRMSLGLTQGIASSVAPWLQDLADAYGTATPILPAVISMTGATATPITSVRVGDVIDTQRRRRDQFLENYSVADVS